MAHNQMHPPLGHEEQVHYCLPKQERLGLSLYQNFWYPTNFVHGVVSFQQHFEAQDRDIIIASQPKSGTTWLIALTFSIINRFNFPLSKSPLLKSNPHELVPNFELKLYSRKGLPCFNHIPDNAPRLFFTHVPYMSLPKSIKNSKCRIIYICRNPLDTIVSLWHFSSQFKGEYRMPLSIDELAKSFTSGVSYYGPFWEHVLSYWNESLANSKKVLFLKYEDVKDDTIFHIKKVAEFSGCPFSYEEESNGVIDQILELCSLNNLRNLEVNKNENMSSIFENKSFFRKGEVGDWVNYLNPSSVESIKNVTKQKLSRSGLEFRFS